MDVSWMRVSEDTPRTKILSLWDSRPRSLGGLESVLREWTKVSRE